MLLELRCEGVEKDTIWLLKEEATRQKESICQDPEMGGARCLEGTAETRAAAAEGIGGRVGEWRPGLGHYDF